MNERRTTSQRTFNTIIISFILLWAFKNTQYNILHRRLTPNRNYCPRIPLDNQID